MVQASQRRGEGAFPPRYGKYTGTIKHSGTVLIAVLVAGCAAGAGRPGADSFRPEAFAAPSVEVKNRGWTEFTIYLAQGSSRFRVGTVSGVSEARVLLPRNLADGGATLVLLAAEPGGGSEVRSPPFEIMPDRQVVWVLEADPNRSHLSIR
ncbi:MAG: hypothetical protein WEA09_00575 [Gemmatimonadota bacterium]